MAISQNPFTRPFEIFDPEDWWSVLAAGGLDPSQTDLPGAPGWWTEVLLPHARTFANRLVAAPWSQARCSADELAAASLNAWLVANCPSLAIQRGDDGSLGGLVPTTMPWQEEGGSAAWLIQLQSLPLVEALQVRAYEGATIEIGEGAWRRVQGAELRNLIAFDDVVVYPGLAVWLPVDFEGPGVAQFGERALQRGAVSLKDLLGFFEHEGLLRPVRDAQDNRGVRAVWGLILDRVGLFLGPRAANRIETSYSGWFMSRHPGVMLDPDSAPTWQYLQAVLERCWIFLTGPLATRYEKCRVGCVGGIVGHYQKLSDAWRETFGTRYFGVTLLGREGWLWNRKLQTFSGGSVSDQLDRYSYAHPDSGVDGVESLRIRFQADAGFLPEPAQCALRSAHLHGSDETFYRFGWTLRARSSGELIDIHYIRDASGSLTGWTSAEPSVHRRLSRAELQRIFSGSERSYALRFGLALPQFGEAGYFQPEVERGPIYALEGAEVRFTVFDRATPYRFEERVMPRGWSSEAGDGCVLVKSEVVAPEACELALMVAETGGAQRRALVRLPVVPARARLTGLTVEGVQMRGSAPPMLAQGDRVTVEGSLAPPQSSQAVRLRLDGPGLLAAARLEIREDGSFSHSFAVSAELGDATPMQQAVRLLGRCYRDAELPLQTLAVRRLEPWLAGAVLTLPGVMSHDGADFHNLEAGELLAAPLSFSGPGRLDFHRIGIARQLHVDGSELPLETASLGRDDLILELEVHARGATTSLDGLGQESWQGLGFDGRGSRLWVEPGVDTTPPPEVRLVQRLRLRGRDVPVSTAVEQRLSFDRPSLTLAIGQIRDGVFSPLTELRDVDEHETIWLCETDGSGRLFRSSDGLWHLEPAALGAVEILQAGAAAGSARAVALHIAAGQTGQLVADVDGREVRVPIRASGPVPAS